MGAGYYGQREGLISIEPDRSQAHRLGLLGAAQAGQRSRALGQLGARKRKLKARHGRQREGLAWVLPSRPGAGDWRDRLIYCRNRLCRRLALAGRPCRRYDRRRGAA